jgi:alpha-glucosidase
MNKPIVPESTVLQAGLSPSFQVSETAGNELRWWQRAAIYEVAVISFKDSNGDGKGDLKGLFDKIDYFEWLGIDAVWLTPIYPSPMLDFGYDISDFCAVDPIFGSLKSFDRLVNALHSRHTRLILDFVPNHTSDQHPWFVDSRSSRTSEKRDWFVWADPDQDGGPPNNWLSRFGGSAWEWDELAGQYYYHSFLKQQPDLNWHNPSVRAAMADVLRFWMKRGVDGFRVDASAVLAEDELLRDDPPDPEATDATPPPQRLRRVFTDDRRESLGYIEEIRSVIDEFDDRVLLGEVQGKTDRIGHFYGNAKPRLHLPLNFSLLDSPWDAISLQAHIDAYMNAIPDDSWPDWVIGGHDKKRITSKIGQAQARVLAMLLFTLRGTPIFFAGDELGMEQQDIPPDRVDDPFEKLVPGYDLSRDGERVPMRWNADPQGGFTLREPWLPLGKDVETRNVRSLQADHSSILWLYRRLIELRRREKIFISGDYAPLRSRNDILAYRRGSSESEVLVALNLVHEPRLLDWHGHGSLLLSTYLDRDGRAAKGPLLLRPDEGVIIQIEG